MAKTTKPAQTAATRPVFQEWEAKIIRKEGKPPEAEKLKCRRARVLISEEQAAVLNNGALYGPNTYVSMYFPADSNDAAAAE